ncbi:MAG: hypothetical protein DRI69_06835, partial [Bacteroidetes bacterium]
MTTTNTRQILIPTDFSKCSVSAFECAVYWSAKMPVKLHLYHRIAGMPREWDSSPDDLRANEKVQTAISKAQIKFDPWKRILDKENIDYTINFSGGNVSEYIAQYVEEHMIDYIFMGS